MTIATGRRAATEVVVDIAKADPGTADFIAEALIYEALAEEIDRVRPFLERDGARVIAKRVEGALENIAKRYTTASPSQRAELEEMAGELAELLVVAKADGDNTITPDDPNTPWWDAREHGRFASGRGRATSGTIDALRLFAGHKGKRSQEVSDAAAGHMRQIKNNTRYDNARVLGNALGTIGHKTGTGSVTAAGHLVRLAGEIGPEAANIFGRGLKRLSYRYRGTERRPDPTVAEQARKLAGTDRAKSDDRFRLTVIGNLGTHALYGHLPNLKLAELSLASGHLPPSRGLLFDSHGNVVSESVGYNGDHYLPFDLKNLKRLNGGQYVRTRTTGGLTDEDIYTGLLTGARQVQVVSNSGVFTIEFDPQLRGGRRYSDKARQMVGRYADLLSAINSSEKTGLLAQDLTPREKAEMRRQANTRAKGDDDLAYRYYQEAERKARSERRFAAKDDDELLDEAHEQAQREMTQQHQRGQVKGVSARTLSQRQSDIFRDLKAAQREQQVRYYKLDGEGYDAAQKALAQEFPLFIRSTSYHSLEDWARRTGVLKPDDPLPPRPGKDIGYTRRGMLGPKDKGEGGQTRETADEGSTGGTQDTPGFRSGESREAAVGEAPWQDLLTEPGSPIRKDLANALARSLAGRRRIAEGMEAPNDINQNDDEALAEGGEAWGAWALHKKGGARGVANFLMDPDTDEEHLNKAIDALRVMKGVHESGDPEYAPYDQADEAIALIERIKVLRHPFAEHVEDAVLAEPDADSPAPPPMPDILDLVGDRRALADYAGENEDVANRARSIRAAKNGDQDAADKINEMLHKVRAIEKWPVGASGVADPDYNSPVDGLTSDDVDQWHRDAANTELYQQLEAEQTAWALARAAEVTEAMTGSGVPELSPKVQKRDDRSVPRLDGKASRFYARSVSKSGPLQQRLGPSATSRPSSPSLAEVLAKRLADDPRYLEHFLPARPPRPARR